MSDSVLNKVLPVWKELLDASYAEQISSLPTTKFRFRSKRQTPLLSPVLQPMDERQEAKELITKWVFEGKDLEEVYAKLNQSRYAGLLSANDIVTEFYAAGTAKKYTRPSGAQTICRFLGIVAILFGLGAVIGSYCCGTPTFGRGITAFVLGIFLTFWPHEALKQRF